MNVFNFVGVKYSFSKTTDVKDLDAWIKKIFPGCSDKIDLFVKYGLYFEPGFTGSDLEMSQKIEFENEQSKFLFNRHFEKYPLLCVNVDEPLAVPLYLIESDNEKITIAAGNDFDREEDDVETQLIRQKCLVQLNCDGILTAANIGMLGKPYFKVKPSENGECVFNRELDRILCMSFRLGFVDVSSLDTIWQYELINLTDKSDFKSEFEKQKTSRSTKMHTLYAAMTKPAGKKIDLSEIDFLDALGYIRQQQNLFDVCQSIKYLGYDVVREFLINEIVHYFHLCIDYISKSVTMFSNTNKRVVKKHLIFYIESLDAQTRYTATANLDADSVKLLFTLKTIFPSQQLADVSNQIILPKRYAKFPKSKSSMPEFETPTGLGKMSDSATVNQRNNELFDAVKSNSMQGIAYLNYFLNYFKLITI